MSLPVTVPFTFGNATTTQSLSSLDTNFTTITNSVNGLTNGASKINVASISATGTANNTTFLRGDGVWGTPAGGGGNTSIISNGTSNVSVTSLNGPVSISTNGNNAVYVDSSGNVGIGTSSPSQKLQVVGSTNQLSITTGSQELIARATSSEVALYTFQALPMSFYTNNAARLTIDTSGNVQVGGTTVANTVGYVNSRTNTRAWARWNGTNGVITSSYNVSSVTRNSTGDYTVAYTTALADANYAILTSGAGDTAYGGYGMYVQLKAAPTTTGCSITTRNNSGTYADQPSVQIAVFGN